MAFTFLSNIVARRTNWKLKMLLGMFWRRIVSRKL
ncbi:hypothetical protein GLYMA_12G098101v4 [Glycine max]|nr:hypothetical protein GLYMA_12G098101v4 [Glycine max]KAH1142453.1 hypothetical protein GYH30_033240 [Glycine max]